MNTNQQYILITEQVVSTDLIWEHARQICGMLEEEFDAKFNIITWSNDRDDTKYYISVNGRRVNRFKLHDMVVFTKGIRAAWRS